MNEYLQHNSHCLADGGLFAPAVMRQLERDEMRALFLEFFSPYASGKREP